MFVAFNAFLLKNYFICESYDFNLAREKDDDYLILSKNKINK